jgi:hypothetical protein
MKARSAIVRTLGAAAAAGALAWCAMTGATAGASAGGGGTTAVQAAADEAPGYAVEDFNYPNADKILAEQGITLKRGDGHIVLADCASATDLLQVRARATSTVICFRVTGNSGFLTLEIPSVYAVKGNAYDAQVDMTTGTGTDAEEKTFDITKNTWTAVGETADDQTRPFMLMEIRTSK